MKTAAAVLALVLALFALPAGATTYRIDPDHTSVLFKVRHLFTTVNGRFEKFEGKIVLDEKDFSKSHVEGSIDAATINTNVARRDQHLRSADFFDVQKFPKILFKTTEVTDIDADEKTGTLKGLLTIHGVERPVEIDAAFLGVGKDPGGNQRAGFRGTTTIDRKDFGLNWNKALEAGGFLVGDEVTIEIDAEGIAEK